MADVIFNGTTLTWDKDVYVNGTALTVGQKIYLNNSEIRFKGIAMHSEPIGIDGPAFSQEHFKELLSTAKELNINFVRAAHYPYTRHLAKIADQFGLMLWEEVPVYWNISGSGP